MEKFKMTQSKKATWTLVLNETQVKALDSIRSNMVKGKGSIDNAVIQTAKHLGDEPTLDLWLATFDRLQKDFETINKIAEKTAQELANFPIDLAKLHLDQIKLILDKEEPDYRN